MTLCLTLVAGSEMALCLALAADSEKMALCLPLAADSEKMALCVTLAAGSEKFLYTFIFLPLCSPLCCSAKLLTTFMHFNFVHTFLFYCTVTVLLIPSAYRFLC